MVQSTFDNSCPGLAMITGVSENLGTDFFWCFFGTVIMEESLLTDCQQNKEFEKKSFEQDFLLIFDLDVIE